MSPTRGGDELNCGGVVAARGTTPKTNTKERGWTLPLQEQGPFFRSRILCNDGCCLR